MKIENAKELFFKNKEHYLQFRQSWKDYINSGKAKPIEQTYAYSGGVYKASRLTCKHHLLYKLLQGKDTEQMFRANTKVHGQSPLYAFYAARDSLVLASVLYRQNPEKANSTRYFDEIREPFGDTLTIDMLSQLVEEIKDWKPTHLY